MNEWIKLQWVGKVKNKKHELKDANTWKLPRGATTWKSPAGTRGRAPSLPTRHRAADENATASPLQTAPRSTVSLPVLQEEITAKPSRAGDPGRMTDSRCHHAGPDSSGLFSRWGTRHCCQGVCMSGNQGKLLCEIYGSGMEKIYNIFWIKVRCKLLNFKIKPMSRTSQVQDLIFSSGFPNMWLCTAFTFDPMIKNKQKFF